MQLERLFQELFKEEISDRAYEGAYWKNSRRTFRDLIERSGKSIGSFSKANEMAPLRNQMVSKPIQQITCCL